MVSPWPPVVGLKLVKVTRLSSGVTVYSKAPIAGFVAFLEITLSKSLVIPEIETAFKAGALAK